MVFLPRPLARGQETLPGTEEGLESLLISPFQQPLPGVHFPLLSREITASPRHVPNSAASSPNPRPLLAVGESSLPLSRSGAGPIRVQGREPGPILGRAVAPSWPAGWGARSHGLAPGPSRGHVPRALYPQPRWSGLKVDCGLASALEIRPGAGGRPLPGRVLPGVQALLSREPWCPLLRLPWGVTGKKLNPHSQERMVGPWGGRCPGGGLLGPSRDCHSPAPR